MGYLGLNWLLNMNGQMNRIWKIGHDSFSSGYRPLYV
jgi:hypothetical protein